MESTIPKWCRDVIDEFTGGSVSNEQIADLALRLAASGTMLPKRTGLADVASTGGPASLTTLLCPLILVAAGGAVAKVGVPGRPAGVIDTLGSIPGYRTRLNIQEFEIVLEKARFANVLASRDFAPADTTLFRARQALGAQAVPPLVIASLLSKKMAAGLDQFAIDIRVLSTGNFGRNIGEAEGNATLLKETAALLGMTASTVVSDGEAPGQPYIGRLEALIATHHLCEGTANPWLKGHLTKCESIADTLLPAKDKQQPVSHFALRDALDGNLTAQGLDGYACLANHINKAIESQAFEEIRARRSGTLEWNLDFARQSIVTRQRALSDAREVFSDPCGVQLLVKAGTRVEADEPIALARALNKIELNSFALEISQSAIIIP